MLFFFVSETFMILLLQSWFCCCKVDDFVGAEWMILSLQSWVCRRKNAWRFSFFLFELEKERLAKLCSLDKSRQRQNRSAPRSVSGCNMSDLPLHYTISFLSSSVFKSRVTIIIIHRFYIPLFSALEQTHCARM